jgi:formylglycine-generating enzyme required for sulfatase activity
MALIAAIPELAGSDAWKSPTHGEQDVGSGAFPGGRTVSLSAYRIARYETTYGLWYEVKTWAASHGYTFANAGRAGQDGAEGKAPAGDASRPVTTISWWDAVVWCNAYSELSGKTPFYTVNGAPLKNAASPSAPDAPAPGRNGFRLPTEAEWEAAARGGDPVGRPADWACVYAGSGTVDEVAWYRQNSKGGVSPVGTVPDTDGEGPLPANGAGLYDMSGNVLEWCYDCFGPIRGGGTEKDPAGPASGPLRVRRGGSWGGSAASCENASRGGSPPSSKNFLTGFRVAYAP